MKYEDFEVGEIYHIIEGFTENSGEEDEITLEWDLVCECTDVYKNKVVFKVLLTNLSEYWKVEQDYWLFNEELKNATVRKL